MSETPYKGNNRLKVLFVALVPILFFGILHLWTKRARADVSTMVYPEKMFQVGMDTFIKDGGYKVLDSVYHEIPDFNLTNQYNQSISKADFGKKIIVVDFFFTSCPSICPKMSEQMARVQTEMIRDDEVIFLSYTIDPTRDSVSVLKAYGEEYGAIPGKWHFLTGDKDEIYDLAANGYKLSAHPDGGEETHDGFVHSERFVLIDPDWNIRGYYNGTDIKDVNFMMGDISLLLKEYDR